MPLVFGPDEEAAYFAARDELLAELRAWADDAGAGNHADSLLDFKWGYCDGDLGTWRVEDLDGFFTFYLPRKVMLPDDMVADVAPDVRSLLLFLADTGRLTRGSDPVPRLLSAVEKLAADLPARMADPGNWSMGKSLTSAMAAEGVEIGDQDAMDAWIRDFNARPYHEREALTGGPSPAPPPPPALDDEPLPARPRPDPELVAQVAADAPILATMLQLAEYLGAGRPLTKKGNLKLVDARALVELLETGDELERSIGDHSYTPRSAQDIPGLDTIVEWAKAARVVRIVKGSMAGTASFAKLARDPVAGLDRLVDTMFEVGPLVIHRPWVSIDLSALDYFVDASVHSVVISLYALDDWFAFDELVDQTVGMIMHGTTRPGWLSEQFVEDHVRSTLAGALAEISRAGVVLHTGYTEGENRYGHQRIVGGEISLTPYGVRTIQRLAPGWGFEAPIVEPFAASPDDEWPVVMQALAAQLENGGPVALIDAFDSLGPVGSELLSTGWRLDDDAVALVLESIGRHHLDKPTARSARKALFQHRSWRANLN